MLYGFNLVLDLITLDYEESYKKFKNILYSEYLWYGIAFIDFNIGLIWFLISNNYFIFICGALGTVSSMCYGQIFECFRKN